MIDIDAIIKQIGATEEEAKDLKELLIKKQHEFVSNSEVKRFLYTILKKVRNDKKKGGFNMRWNDTEASRCRYGDVAQNIWGDCEILWEDSDVSYSGYAHILAKHEDGRYSFYEWTYGSCASCDSWENAGFSIGDIEKEMRHSSIWFESREELSDWLKLLKRGREELQKDAFDEDEGESRKKSLIRAIELELNN